MPFVVLSATTDIPEKAALLELGADDYVTKPFSPRELLARVRTAVRHRLEAKVRDLAAFSGVCVDFTRREVILDGEPVELTNHEFNILKLFSQNAKRAISREELLRDAFGYDLPTSRILDNHM